MLIFVVGCAYCYAWSGQKISLQCTIFYYLFYSLIKDFRFNCAAILLLCREILTQWRRSRIVGRPFILSLCISPCPMSPVIASRLFSPRGILKFLVHRSLFQRWKQSSWAKNSSSLGATALREPWPPVLFASTGPYPELSFSILQSPSLVGPLERHLAI